MIIAISSLLLGYLLCYITNSREWKSLYNQTREDYRKVVNEWSIRTGGRTVHKEERKVETFEPEIDKGKYGIFIPSMAESEEEERAEIVDELPQMTEDDWEYLKNQGLVR